MFDPHSLGKSRRCGLVGGDALLGADFKVSKAQARPSFVFFFFFPCLLPVDQYVSSQLLPQHHGHISAALLSTMMGKD